MTFPWYADWTQIITFKKLYLFGMYSIILTEIGIPYPESWAGTVLIIGYFFY